MVLLCLTLFCLFGIVYTFDVCGGWAFTFMLLVGLIWVVVYGLLPFNVVSLLLVNTINFVWGVIIVRFDFGLPGLCLWVQRGWFGY